MPPAAIMGGAAAIGAVGSVAAGNAAAGAATDAARLSNQAQLSMFNTANALNAPWRQTGGQAMNALGAYYIPGFQATNPFAAPVASMPGGGGGGGGGGISLNTALNPLRVGQEPGSLLGGGLSGLVGGLFGGGGNNRAGNIARQLGVRGAPASGAAAVPTPYSAPVQSPQDLISFFQQSPGYQFRLEEGQNQLDRMAGRGGNFFSGRALQGAQQYGQNFASNEWGNYINQLNNLAGLGSTAAGQSSQNAINTGNMMGQNYNAMGAARAGAYQNAGNAFSNLVNQGANIYGYYNQPMGAAGPYG